MDRPVGHRSRSRPDETVFRSVVLRNRTTWYRATFLEWVRMRGYLKAKFPGLDTSTPSSLPPADASADVSARIAQETEGPGGARELYAIGPHAEASEPTPGIPDVQSSKEGEPPTAWEKEFMFVSRWLDGAYDTYMAEGPKNTVSLLVEWLLTLESESGLADWRRKQRDRNWAAVADENQVAMHYNKNPIYPKAIELVYVARACRQVLEILKVDYAGYCAPHKERALSQEELDSRFKEFLYTGEGGKHLVRFVEDLRRLDYSPEKTEDECLEWLLEHERKLMRPAKVTRELLAFLFHVRKSTVDTDLNTKRLNLKYEAAGIDRRLRVHFSVDSFPRSVWLFRSGWTTRLCNGRPIPTDHGSNYRRNRTAK